MPSQPYPKLADLGGARAAADYGAKADGATDDTAAIQSALTAAGQAGGGVVQLLPASYRIAGTLSVPASVTLRGTNAGPAGVLSGTVLRITGGAGASTGQAITLGDSAGLDGLTFYYPSQPVSASTPTAYPYTVGTWAGTSGVYQNNQSIRNCCFWNSYQAVNVFNTARVTIQDCLGSPISIGINTDGSGDCCRYSNIQWNPFYTGIYGSNLAAWIQANGVAFRFGRSDEQVCSELFSFGYHAGYRFVSSHASEAGGGATQTYGTFTNCSADQTDIAIDCQSVQGFGVDFVGGGFVADGTGKTYISMADGTLSVSGARLWNYSNGFVLQSGGSLRMVGNYLRDATALAATGGTLIFASNLIDSAATTLTLSGSVRATLTGNTAPAGSTFTGMIASTSSGSVVIGSNN